MQSKDLIQVLKNPEAKAFVIRHLNDDVVTLNLKYRGKVSFDLTLALQLISLYKKAKSKIPLFVEHHLALTQKSFEQSTSQKVAEFKAGLLGGNLLLSGTGGLGVDDLFFCKTFSQVISADIDDELNALVHYNIEELGINNYKRITADAKTALSQKCDWVYLDPDRRPQQKREFVIQEMTPNVIELLPTIKKVSSKLALKLSPLFDITEALRVFDHVSDIYVISLENEVKELLLLFDFRKNKNPEIHACEVGKRPFHISSSSLPKRKEHDKSGEPGYVYIGQNALRKGGFEMDYFERLGARKDVEFQIYYGSQIIESNAVRTFEVVNSCSPNNKQLKKTIKQLGLKQLVIVIKGLNEKQATWYKKLGVSEGGDVFLFILIGKEKKAIFCRAISS